jgi:TaqI restriction endonuclease
VRKKSELQEIQATEKFESFLKGIDLGSLREAFRQVKIVEMDLPQQIWPVHSIYEVYWVQREYLSFDEYYELYVKSLKKELREFRSKIGMCKKCFDKGLKARVYRTWASLLTQIHVGYLGEQLYGPNSVEMNSKLDAAGVDLAITTPTGVIAIQIKKSSARKEARLARVGMTGAHIVQLSYDVPANLLDPYKRNGELRLPVKRFRERKDLRALENGFVTFTLNGLIEATVVNEE